MTTYEGSKLNATHLERAAVVYVRQSTDFQVHNHVERQRLQYELTTHAKELGFRTVTVIDDDLGTSASGVHRPGFEKLLTAVCRGEVGLVLFARGVKIVSQRTGLAYAAGFLCHCRLSGR